MFARINVLHIKTCNSCKRQGSNWAQRGNDGEDGEMKSRYCLHLHISSAVCLEGYGRWFWHRSVERLKGERWRLKLVNLWESTRGVTAPTNQRGHGTLRELCPVSSSLEETVWAPEFTMNRKWWRGYEEIVYMFLTICCFQNAGCCASHSRKELLVFSKHAVERRAVLGE